jgi:hypothetical protein
VSRLLAAAGVSVLPPRTWPAMAPVAREAEPMRRRARAARTGAEEMGQGAATRMLWRLRFCCPCAVGRR